jgi:carboxymethylenebutenolidase
MSVRRSRCGTLDPVALEPDRHHVRVAQQHTVVRARSEGARTLPEIEFPTGAGGTPAYLAVPPFGDGPAAIVVHEWWGLDEHIRSVCDRLAGEGFFALAPDLYRGVSCAQPSEVERRLLALSMDTAVEEMRAAAEYLLSRPDVRGAGVGVLGFGLGGGLGIWAAAACPQIAAAVTYYHLMPDGKPDFRRISAQLLGHFGTADTYISVKDAKAKEQALRDAGVWVRFEKYTGAGHSFFKDSDRLTTYDRDAAQISWERTVGFLGGTLAPDRANTKALLFSFRRKGANKV